MKTLGILGGLGPESTVIYYREIIDRYRSLTGNDTYPHILINSVDMTRVIGLIADHAYEPLVQLLAGAIEHLATAGADVCAISSNTPHVVFDRVAARVNVPMVSIVSATAERARTSGLKRVLLIGTKFTMRNDFYARTFEKYGITCIVPDAAGQDTVHDIIFPELESGIVRADRKETMLRLCTALIERERLDGIILGCTELPLMLTEDDFDVAVLDTARIHLEKLVAGIVDG